MTTHPNSRKVTLYRKSSFIMDAQLASAPEFVSQAKKPLGSYWENSTSMTIGSGLNFTEQKLLMPTLVDCEPEDRNFRAKVAEFFKNIKTAVPYEKGREFEIGLETDNNKPLSQDNMPLNLADYVAYRHAINHPLVAANKEAAEGDLLKEYYIYDPAEVQSNEIAANNAKDTALEYYLTIKKSPEKVDMLLTLLAEDPRTFKGKNALALKLARLKELAEIKPTKFVEAFDNKFLAELYTIHTMINVGVLTKVGERIIDKEAGDTLGHTMEEAVAWIKDKKNSERLVILKARMQEALGTKTATEKATA